MTKRLRANLMLLLTAFIWGVAFVAQDVAMDTMPPFGFNAVRTLLSALTLLLTILLLDRFGKRHPDKAITRKPQTPAERRTLWRGGLLCGVALFVSTSCQQLGIQCTSAGKAGFVTALYIVLVPLSGLFFRRRVGWHVWLAVAISLVGLFLLCVTSTLTVDKGDIYLMLCAVGFTCHILIIDRFSPKVDCVRMSCIQFFVTSGLCGVCSAFLERPTWAGVLACAVPIVYAGVLSGAAGYTLQMLAQRDTDPTVASLLMCLESVFAVLAGWLLLGDLLSPRELAGCALMFTGILLAQAPVRQRKLPNRVPAA